MYFADPNGVTLQVFVPDDPAEPRDPDQSLEHLRAWTAARGQPPP